MKKIVNKISTSSSCTNRQCIKFIDKILCKNYSTSANQPNIIILGAGIAGLTAAQTLHHYKYENVKILEASDRYGGRIQTEKFGDVNCHLGAKENPMNDNHSVIFHKSSGKLQSNPISTAVVIYFRKLKQDMLKDALVQEGNLNLHDCLVDRMKHILPSFSETTRIEAVSVFYGLLSNLRSTFGSDLRNVSALLGAKKLKELNDHFEVTASYGPSISEIVQSLPTDWLHLGTPISKIQWKSNEYQKHLIVHTLTGDRFVADFVICTIPIGALQSLCEVMFDPPLSEQRVEPFKNIGIGKIEKIFLRFDEPIEKWFSEPIYLAWNRNELLNRQEWISGICSILKASKSKYVLEVTVAGDQAEDMTLISADSQILNDVTTVLKKFLANESIPFPNEMLRTNWTKDTKYLGSLSYPTTKTTMYHLSTIKKPIDVENPRLLFAGEATIPEFLGTVFGARLSGIREADRIIQYVRKKSL